MAQNRPRSRRSSTTRRTTRPMATAAATMAQPAEVRPAEIVDWKTEYAYVFRDLKQLGLVSVTIFVLLLIVGWLM